MPSLKEHCDESVRLFGKPFTEVHQWLDGLFQVYGPKHRRKRHHEEGLRQVARIFGSDAVAPARQHIVSDLKSWGWRETDLFPKDEADYIEHNDFISPQGYFYE